MLLLLFLPLISAAAAVNTYLAMSHSLRFAISRMNSNSTSAAIGERRRYPSRLDGNATAIFSFQLLPLVGEPVCLQSSIGYSQAPHPAMPTRLAEMAGEEHHRGYELVGRAHIPILDSDKFFHL
jgi:hypothetical protein